MIVSVKQAVFSLQQGDLVAIPTETVYGLAADAFNLGAIEKIFFAKGRPSDNPLIVHIANIEQLQELTEEISPQHQLLMDEFWPGPLTLIFKKKPEVLDKITGGLHTVAVRMPSHPIALEIIKKTGPLVAPSANKSGRPSTTRVEHVLSDYVGLIPVVDGGKCDIGLESTVFDCSNGSYSILRPGKIGIKELRKALDSEEIHIETENKNGTPRSPGMKYTHYSPNAKVRWMNPNELEGEYHSNIRYLHVHGDFNSTQHKGFLSNIEHLSKELYDQFRFVDEIGIPEIAIEPFDKSSNAMTEALFNRIQKAIGAEE